MPLSGKGRRILAKMSGEYGSLEKAKRVFYGAVNKGTITGVEPAKSRGKLSKMRRKK